MKVHKCRISGSKNLIPILNLGIQKLTGVFPSYSNQKIYMIGVSWYTENKLKHKCFLLDYNKSDILKKEFETNKQYDDINYHIGFFKIHLLKSRARSIPDS